MKRIPFTKPIAVIPVGYPGSGKTFFAKQLGDKLGMPVISYERIVFELFETPELSKAEKSIVERIYNYMISTHIRAKTDFICDSNFNTLKSRKAITKALTLAGYVPLVVWIQTDMDTSFSRAGKRNKQKNDDKYRPSITMEEFDKEQKAFTRPHEKETYAVVSGKHAFSAQYRTVLRKLTLLGALDSSSIATIQHNVSK